MSRAKVTSHRKARKPARRRDATHAQLEKMIRSKREAKPILGKKLFKELAQAIDKDTFRLTRACALMYLTESGKSIFKKVAEDANFAEATMQLANSVHEYLERLAELSAWMSEAERRMLGALSQRPDAEQMYQKLLSEKSAEQAAAA